MLTPSQLLRAFNELLLLLLGILLMMLTVTGRYAIPRHSPLWMALGAFLIYWGLRAWWRARRNASRWEQHLRGGSLALVGAIMLALGWLPWRGAAVLLGLAGGILALRGLVGAVLAIRTAGPGNTVANAPGERFASRGGRGGA